MPESLKPPNGWAPFLCGREAPEHRRPPAISSLHETVADLYALRRVAGAVLPPLKLECQAQAGPGSHGGCVCPFVSRTVGVSCPFAGAEKSLAGCPDVQKGQESAAPHETEESTGQNPERDDDAAEPWAPSMPFKARQSLENWVAQCHEDRRHARHDEKIDQVIENRMNITRAGGRKNPYRIPDDTAGRHLVGNTIEVLMDAYGLTLLDIMRRGDKFRKPAELRSGRKAWLTPASIHSWRKHADCRRQ